MRENIALALDGSAILLVAIGLWLAFQRRNWAGIGVALGVVGLAVMAGTAALRAYPNPSLDALRAKIETLRAKTATARDELGKAEAAGRADRQKAAELTGQNARLTESLEETRGRLRKETEAAHRLAQEVEKLRRERADARSEAGKARADGDSTRADLEKARSDALRRLESLMSAGLSTGFYRIAVLPERELVSGKVGAYFSVRLKDRATGAQLIFQKGHYRFTDEAEKALLEATDRFVREIVSGLAGVAEYRAFVRGRADAEPVANPRELSQPLSIVYRPLGDAGRYDPVTSERPIRAPIGNDDLPDLRAAYFRSVVHGKLADREVDILHNVPSKVRADEERTVELILYVRW